MLKKSITYTDYNSNDRTENFYFNLSKAELMEMQLTTTGGFDVMIQNIIDAQDMPTLMKIFKDIILKSYGEKSADGKRFVKSEEISKAFSETEAYSVLYMELLTDSSAAAKFISALVPQDVAEKAQAQMKAQQAQLEVVTD